MTGKREVDTSKKTWRAWDDIYRRQPRTWRGPAVETELQAASGIVLELGCGSGKTLRSLAAAELVVGLDVSRAALVACRRDKDPGNVSLVQGDASRLPFAGSSVDAVIAHHVLGHLLANERAESAAEMARVLRPGGALSVRVLSREDMRSGMGEEIEPNTYLRGTGVFCHFFDEDEVRGLFRAFDVKSLGKSETRKRYEGESALRSAITAELIRPA